MTLENFFNPRSVAIIGASHTPGKIGFVILENFVKGGFPGRIHPVNPDTTPIFSLPVFTSVKEISDKIDLAVIAVPAKLVPKILKECTEKNIQAVIVVSSGFAESGEEGKKLEENLKKIIKNKGTRVLGPNCLGVVSPSAKMDTLFLPKERIARPKAGSISLVSQSGAVGSMILDMLAAEGIGLSRFVSYENAADINETDCLEYLGNDDETKTILLFFEGVKEGRRFLEVAKKVSKKKPVVVLKGGKTEIGAQAALSHTGSLAGSAKIYSAVFKQTGISEAMTWEELVDFAKIFLQPLPAGKRMLVVTDGGGFGILAADEASIQGLELPTPSEKLKEKIKKVIPFYGALNNPIDITGDATAEMYQAVLGECLQTKEYDLVLAVTLFGVPSLTREVINVITDLQKFGKPVACCTEPGVYAKNFDCQN